MSDDGMARRESDIEMGKLIESVNHLNKAVDLLWDEVKSLRKDRDTGKGILTGLMLASGLVGGIISQFLNFPGAHK